MEDRGMTMKKYVQFETERALRNGKVYNWKTTTYGKIWYDEDVHYLRFVETKFPAIVYNDAFASKSGFSSEPAVSPQHVDEVNLKYETSLSEYHDEEYNVISFNDLFSFNIYYVNDSKLHTDNDDDKINVKQFSRDISIKPLPNIIRPSERKDEFGGMVIFWNSMCAVVMMEESANKTHRAMESLRLEVESGDILRKFALRTRLQSPRVSRCRSHSFH
ncbi:hypothetical protein Tco_0696659 [Tanacetum coccineum]